MNLPSSPSRQAPAAPRRPHVHEAHGVRREDAYHWMRDKLAPEAVANLTAERAYYEAATARLQPLRDELVAEMRARVVPDDESVRWRKGGFLYYTRFLPGQEYPQLRRTPVDDPQGEGEVLLDENELAAGHDYQEIGLHSVSPDGLLLAYSVDHEGDEVYELRFRDLATGRDLGDIVEHTYYTGAWSADSSTFFYTVNDTLYRPYQVWRHEVGTAATSDVLVHQEDDEQFDVTVHADRSGEWVVVTCQSRDTSELWVVPAAEPSRAPEALAPRRHGVEYSVAHAPGEAGGSWLVVTNEGAEEFRLMSAPVGPAGPESWAQLIAENPDERLHAADVFARHLVLTLVRGAQQELRILPLDQVLRGQLPPDPVEVTSGMPGGLLFLGPNEEPESDSVLVRVESYVEPPAWFAIDLDTGRRELAKQTVVPSYDPAAYRVDRRTVAARDGVAVPVTVVHRSDVALDGSAPLLLYGYGAYESAWWPGFEPTLASLLDRGVVFAHAHVRGGGRGWGGAGGCRVAWLTSTTRSTTSSTSPTRWTTSVSSMAPASSRAD